MKQFHYCCYEVLPAVSFSIVLLQVLYQRDCLSVRWWVLIVVNSRSQSIWLKGTLSKHLSQDVKGARYFE